MWVLNEINSNKKKSRIKTIIIILLIIWAIWGYYYFNQKKEVINSFKIAKVEEKNISSSLSSDWKVFYKELYELNFPTSGTLKNLYKKEWDLVKIWEVIAKLDDTYLKINFDKAQIAKQTAEANLSAKLSTKNVAGDINISKEQLNSTKISLETTKKQWQIDIENAQNNLEAIKTTLENTKETTKKDIENSQKSIELKQKDLEIAKDNLETVKNTEDLNLKNSKEKIITEIDIAIPLLEKYFRDIDVIVWITPQNKSLNDSYEPYLWAKNSFTKTLVEGSFVTSFDKYNDFKSKFDIYKINPDLLQVSNYINDTLFISSNLSELLKNTREMLKSSISSISFSQSSIDSLILSIENDINSLNIEIQKITNLEQNIESSRVSLNSKILTAQNSIKSIETQIEQAKINLEKTKSLWKSTLDDLDQKYNLVLTNLSWAKVKLQNSIDLANSQIDISKANLNFKESKIDSRELEPYYTAIKNATKWVEEAQKKLDDTLLKSPINGKIGKLSDIKIWANILQNSQTPFAIVIDKSSLYIEAKIEEWDISKIFLWQETRITFSSLENVELKWKVWFISDKSESDANGIITYKTEVYFDTKDYKWVKEWFTAQVYFILKKLNNILTLPIEAVKTENSISTVTLNDWTKKTIKVWINDGDYVEILEGLNVGEEIRY